MVICISYRALYRKWRPKTFSEVVGQTHIINTLRNEVAHNLFSHAYLFCGTRGTGKTTTAKIFAKAVNCLNLKDTGDPCNECSACEGIMSGRIVDVVEIDAASNNGVDNIREIKEEINYPPSLVRFRVYIIDEVHMLSSGAFNALLKTLEEPPAHVIFILATTEAHKVPVTILSRCQRFDFGRIASKLITEALAEICRAEGVSVSQEALSFIAENSDGSMRDALSKLDMCISSGSSMDLESVCRVLGHVSGKTIFDIVDLVLERETVKVMKKSNDVLSAGVTPSVFLNSLLSHFRKLMICKSAGDNSSLAGFDVSGEDAERLIGQSSKAELSFFLYAAKLVVQSLSEIKFISDKNILSDLLFLRLVNPELSDLPESVIPRLERLESALDSGFSSVEVPQAVDKSVEYLKKNVENSFKKNNNYVTHSSKSVDKVDNSVENIEESIKNIPEMKKNNVDKCKSELYVQSDKDFKENIKNKQDESGNFRAEWFSNIIKTEIPKLSKFMSNARLYFDEDKKNIFIVQGVKAFFIQLDRPEVLNLIKEKTGFGVCVLGSESQLPDGINAKPGSDLQTVQGNSDKGVKQDKPDDNIQDLPPFVQRAKNILKDKFTLE